MPAPALPWTLHPARRRPGGDPATRPTVLVLPGGGYTLHAPHEAEPVAEWLTGLGLNAAVLRYPVGPGCYPDALLAARGALTALRDGTSGLPGDTRRVGVLGFSAGGHLASVLATDRAGISGIAPETYAGRPDLAILCYPVTDLRPQLVDGGDNGRITSGSNLLPGASDELFEELSTAAHVDANTPPCFVWTTADDEVVDARHSLQFVAALAAAGVPYEAHVFAHGRHGLGLLDEVPEVTVWPQLCAAWLGGLGWIERP